MQLYLCNRVGLFVVLIFDASVADGGQCQSSITVAGEREWKIRVLISWKKNVAPRKQPVPTLFLKPGEHAIDHKFVPENNLCPWWEIRPLLCLFFGCIRH